MEYGERGQQVASSHLRSPVSWRWLVVVAALQTAVIVGPMGLGGSSAYGLLVVGGLLGLGLSLFSVERGLLVLLFFVIVLPRTALEELTLGRLRCEEALFAAIFFFALVDVGFRRQLRIRKSGSEAPLIGFFVATGLGVAWGVLRAYPPNAIAEDTRYIPYYGAALLVAYLCDGRKMARRFVYVVIAATVVVSVEYMLEFVGMVSLSARREFYRVAYAQGVMLPIALLFIVSALLYERAMVRRVLLGLAMLPISVAFVITMGRGMWLGFGAGSAVLVVLYAKRRGLKAFAAVLLVIGIIVGMGYIFSRMTGVGIGAKLSRRVSRAIVYERDPHLLGRLFAYKEAYEHAKSSPFFGSGQGVMIAYPTMLEGMMYTSDIDSLYLTLWVKMGIVGLAAFGWMAWRFLRMTYELFARSEDRRSAAFALGTLSSFGAMLVLGISDATMITERFILVFGAAFGIVATDFSPQRRKERKEPP